MDDIQSDNYLKAPNLIPPMGDSTEKQIALLDELRREERLFSVSVIASMIAHFVGTPLNVIVGRAGLIRRHPDATEPIIKDAVCIQQKVEQVTEKLRSLLELLTPQASAAQSEPDALVAEAVALYRPIARMRNVELQISAETGGLARVKRDPLFVVLTSLLSLAIHEVGAGSSIAVQTGTADGSTGGSVVQLVLSVPGCVFDDPRQLGRFERKSHGSVNALQVLGICAAITRNAGGQLHVRAPSEAGSDLILQWPGATQFSL